MSENWKRWEGRIVGKFRLEQYLGGTDHSAVFLTEWETQPPQKAALKLIAAKPETAENQLARWRRVSDLSHPHLLKLFESGRCELDGVPLLYAVSEYAEENLSQVFPVRPLTAEETRQMLEPVLDALTYLRAEGLVHGRIQPSNILAANDQLKLSSDGIAKTGETPAVLSAYAPPESGEGLLLPAGDLWALGLVLVEALTQRQLSVERTAPSEPAIPPIIPAPFFEIARNCLRIDPRRRWTVGDIADRLRVNPAPARPAPRETKILPPAVTKWRYAIPLGAVVLVVAAAIAFRDGSSSSETQQAKVDQQAVRQQAEVAPVKPKPGKPVQTQSKEPAPVAASSVVAEPPKPAASAPTTSATGVAHQVLPRVPQSARNTITGRVRVTVKLVVDEAGNVTGATLASPGPSRYFARLALEAAREWKFEPASLRGHSVPSEWNVRFAFGRESTNVFPFRTVPK